MYKKYLYEVPDMGSKLLFRFGPGTHVLNEELGRHVTRNIIVKLVFLRWLQTRILDIHENEF